MKTDRLKEAMMMVQAVVAREFGSAVRMEVQVTGTMLKLFITARVAFHVEASVNVELRAYDMAMRQIRAPAQTETTVCWSSYNGNVTVALAAALHQRALAMAASVDAIMQEMVTVIAMTGGSRSQYTMEEVTSWFVALEQREKELAEARHAAAKGEA